MSFFTQGWPLPPLFIFLSAILLPSTTWAGNSFFGKLELQAYSAPVTIDSAIANWSGSYDDGERQWLTSWVEFGYTLNNNWRLSILHRSDFDLRFHPETAEFYYQIQNHLPLPTDKSYQLQIEANHFTGSGARFAWSPQFNTKLQTTLGISLLNLYEVTQGSISGSASVTAPNEYQYDIAINYVYDQETLFDRQLDEHPKGLGISTDLYLHYQTGEHQLELEVIDLFNRFTWQHLPFTQATGTSNQQGFDGDGYIIVSPAISGVEGYYQTYYQSLPPRSTLSYTYRLHPQYQTQITYKQIFQQHLFGMGGTRLFNDHQLTATLWPETAALSLAYQHSNNLVISLTMDQLDTRQNRTLWLSLKYN